MTEEEIILTAFGTVAAIDVVDGNPKEVLRQLAYVITILEQRAILPYSIHQALREMDTAKLAEMFLDQTGQPLFPIGGTKQ